MSEQDAGFRDPTALTKWTRGFLYAYLATSLVDVYMNSAYVTYGLSYEGSLAAWLAAGIFWGLLVTGVILGTAILVLSWIYRANYNARQLGASGMAFSPGAAVGWYFIPIAWFWKPYQAMKEIWKASADPQDWKEQGGSPLLGWWWALWLIPFWGLGLASLAATQDMEGPQAERVDALHEIAISSLDVALVLVLLVIVRRIHQMQMGHWSRQRVEAAGV